MKKLQLFFLGLIAAGTAGLLSAHNEVHDMVAINLEKATFAGGCFWCMESPYDRLEGVVRTTVGYTGGTVKNPTYEMVCAGTTGHAEAIEIEYDPKKISYDTLLDVFWRSIDPTQKDGQFADRGSQYRTAIFYHSEEQRRRAEASKAALERSGKFARPIVTEIVAAKEFYPAEEYHQDYYRKNPLHYERYRHGSGRGPFLEEMWKNEKQ